MRVPLISFVGRSGTGKTTVIERLIPLFSARGVRVGTIKHHLHDFDIDVEGKDSYRHKEAGARLAMIVSPRKVALVQDLDEELDLDGLVSRYVAGVDLVITEGYKGEDAPRIEVYDGRGGPPLSLGHAGLVAIVSDLPVEAPVPVFARDDIEGIARFIVKTLGLARITGQAK